VGCVIVDPRNQIVRSQGFNGFPRGIRETVKAVAIPAIGVYSEKSGELDMERWSRPQKYDWVEHAERNAVYNAARVGAAMEGCIAYLNWEPLPCISCTKALIQAGIIAIVGPDIPFGGTRRGDWSREMEFSGQLLDEAGVSRIVMPEGSY